jgi:DNA-binding GntR family transcriptional regulator
LSRVQLRAKRRKRCGGDGAGRVAGLEGEILLDMRFLTNAYCRQSTESGLSLSGELCVSLQRNKNILEAIMSKDPAKAGDVLRNHTLEAKRELLQAITNKKAS